MASSERIFTLLDSSVRTVDDGSLVADHHRLHRATKRLVRLQRRRVGPQGRFVPDQPLSANRARWPHWSRQDHRHGSAAAVLRAAARVDSPQRNGRRYSIESLRRLFAIVQQDLFLFTGSVAENISLGDPAISLERIVAAAKLVQADRFVSRLPAGYASPVRERGGGFSVGEKQLLSFARAFVFDRPLLILDEATSSIDTETEQLIQRGTKTLLEGRTSIVIAHRLSTIRSADAILVFHRGEIRERGTHEELMMHGPLYRRLYEIEDRAHGVTAARSVTDLTN